MRYCKQCGAQMKDGAVFCPKCGTRTGGAGNTGGWEAVNGNSGQTSGQPAGKVTDNEVLRNVMEKLPEGAKEQMKELSGKASEGMSRVADKAREYGGKLAEKAGELVNKDAPHAGTETAAQESFAQPAFDRGDQAQKQAVRSKRSAGNRPAINGKAIAAILLVLVLVIGIGAGFYLSRFTLVGVWKVVDTEDVDLSDIDLTDPKDILEKALLTLGSGTRIVFTKGGDVFATASLGGVTVGPGTMSYVKNGSDSFTIQASIDVVLTTLSASYSCSYEFDGPDRLLVHLGDATLVLTRDKDGDPEEYLEQIQESSFGFNLNLGGDDDSEFELPESGEELKEELQETGEELKENVQEGIENIGGSISDWIGGF